MMLKIKFTSNYCLLGHLETCEKMRNSYTISAEKPKVKSPRPAEFSP